mgnify:CR=1 FL=1
MKLIEHFVGGKIIPGKSDKKGKVFNPATGEQEKEVRLASKLDLDQAVIIAQNAFEELSRLEPDTSLYKLYIQRCLQFLDSPPDKEWDGVFHQNHPDSSSLSSSKRPLNDDSV